MNSNSKNSDISFNNKNFTGEVIVIDIEKLESDNLRKFLLAEGLLLHQFDNSHQAVLPEQYISNSYKVFLISLDIKHQDPLTIYHQLKTHYPLARIGFISSIIDSESLEKVLTNTLQDIGMQAFFTKPLSFKKFLDWINTDKTSSQSQARLNNSESLENIDNSAFTPHIH